MTPWLLIPSLLIAIAVLLGVSVVLRRSRTRRRRLRLRLLSGHRGLLGDEIDRRTRSLGEVDTANLDAARAQANLGLNELHADLLDRQAHLQNFEDLAFLQRQKLAVLTRSLFAAEAATDHSPGLGQEAAPVNSPTPPDAERGTTFEHRGRIESDLLQKIEDLQKPQDPDVDDPK